MFSFLEKLKYKQNLLLNKTKTAETNLNIQFVFFFNFKFNFNHKIYVKFGNRKKDI